MAYNKVKTTDVLLIRPWNNTTAPAGGLVEDSLGVGYLAAYLRLAGIQTTILDAFTLGYNDDQLVNMALHFNPKIVGLSLHSFADYKHVVYISKMLRDKLPNCFQIAGGEHATYLAEEILTELQTLDAVIISEGEVTLTELAKNISDGEYPQFLQGAFIRNKSGMITNGGHRPAIENLDLLPIPEKDIVETAILLNKPVALSILSGRGCTHRCTFCTAHNFLRLGGGNVWRRRTPKLVVDELEQIYKKYYGLPNVHEMVQFQDVIFLGTSKQAKQWTVSFLDEMEKRNLFVPFYIMTRSDAIISHKDQLERLAINGLRSVEIGLETGVTRILQEYNKQNSLEDLKKAIDLLNKNNICYDASGYIMFDPRMSLEEIKISSDFMFDLGHATWDRYITKLQVFPGTVLKKQMIEMGLFDPNANLDDVYAYKFVYSEVEMLAKHVYYYHQSIHALDISIHNARSLAAELIRKGNKNGYELKKVIHSAETLYQDYFNYLILLTHENKLLKNFNKIKINFINDCFNINKLLQTHMHVAQKYIRKVS